MPRTLRPFGACLLMMVLPSMRIRSHDARQLMVREFPRLDAEKHANGSFSMTASPFFTGSFSGARNLSALSA